METSIWLLLARSLMTDPSGKARKLNSRSTKSFPASAKRSLFPVLSMRSFKLSFSAMSLLVHFLPRFTGRYFTFPERRDESGFLQRRSTLGFLTSWSRRPLKNKNCFVVQSLRTTLLHNHLLVAKVIPAFYCSFLSAA